MDLTTARLEVRARLQELTEDFWTTTEIDRALNDGVRRFNAEERWPWLTTIAEDTLVAGATSLELQPGVPFERQVSISVLYDGDPRPRLLRRVTPGEGFRLKQDFYQAQSELSWFWLGSAADAGETEQQYIPTAYFLPECTRDADLTYQYTRRSELLVSAADVIDCPEEYTDGPVSWATGRLYLKELTYSAKSQEQFAIYTKVVDQARKETRRLAAGSGFAWGRSGPEPYGPLDPNTYARMRMPETLGP